MIDTPYANKKEQAKQKRRYRKLKWLRKYDNFALIHVLASASKDTDVLVRAVGVDFKDGSPRASGKYTIHLSTLAVRWEEYTKMLDDMNFPYKVEGGDFFLIKRATKEEIQTHFDKYLDSLEQLLSDLRKVKAK